jgi:zinc protease
MNRRTCWTGLMALACLALSSSIASAQSAGTVKLASVEGITEYQLPNGFRFLLYPDPSASTITFNMTVLVGSRHEGYGETGMAHLLEHMCFKGTPKHPNIDKVLQEHGGNKTANGTTYLDRTNYYETMDATDAVLEFGIMLKADILVNSYIKKADLDKEMTVVRQEFERNENDPFTILNQRITAAAFEWHNYGKSTIGNRADIERVPIENLQAFYRKYYQPDNVVFVLAGKFDKKKAIGYFEKYFGSLKRPERVLQDTYTVEPTQDGERFVALRRVGKVPWVGVVYHVPGTAHEDFAALDVLTTVLSAEPTGQLYKALVEKKLATDVNAGVTLARDPHLLEIYSQVRELSPPEKVRDAITELVEKLESVTEDEVQKSKVKMLADRERSLAKSDKVALELSEWIGAGDWRLLFLHRDRVAKVTAKDVVAVARKYLKPSNRTVGFYLPAVTVDRAAVPENPRIGEMLAGYKGTKSVAQGELFDPTPENLEKRTKRLTLPGGLKVALLPKKTRGEMVVGEITLHFGNEKTLLGKTMTARFLGSLMRRGTSKHDYQQLEHLLDDLGARVSIDSDEGSLSASMHCKRDKLPEVLKLVGEFLREPTFPEQDLDILKAEARQAIEKGLAEPGPLAREALTQHIAPWPKDSIHYSPTMKESLERVAKVSRKDIVDLYADQLGAADAEIAFVGDFDEKQTLEAVANMLQGWQSKTKFERIPTVIKTGIAGGKKTIITPDKESAVYYAGYNFPLNENDPDYPALVIANAVLGDAAFNSRIMDRLRTKEGLTYGAGSRLLASALDKAGGFRISATCNPENMAKLAVSMDEILKTFVKDGVTQPELDEIIKGWLLVRKVDRGSDDHVAASLASQLYLGRTFQRTIQLEKDVSELKAEQVSAAIRRHLDPSRFYTVEAGDFNRKAPPKK